MDKQQINIQYPSGSNNIINITENDDFHISMDSDHEDEYVPMINEQQTEPLFHKMNKNKSNYKMVRNITSNSASVYTPDPMSYDNNHQQNHHQLLSI